MGAGLAAVAALGMSGCGSGYGGSATTTTSTGVGSRTVVSTANVANLGEVLVGPSGRTVYYLTTESASSFKCTASCVTVWSPVRVRAGAPLVLAGGVAAALSTATRP